MKNFFTAYCLACALLLPAISQGSDDGEKAQWTYDPHTLTPEERPDHQEDPQPVDLQESFSAYWQNIGLGIGTYSPFYDRIQVDDQGETNGFEINPMAYLSATVHLSRDFIWTPNLGLVFPNNNQDDNISKQTIIGKSDFGFLWDTAVGVWNFGLAPGIFFERISGGGGQTTLNNGTSTESFFLPEHSNIAYNFTLGALVEWFPWPEWSFKSCADVFALTDSKDRAFSFTLLINWHYLGVQDFWD